MATEKRMIYMDDTMDRLRAYADRKHQAGYTELANGILKAVNYIHNEIRRVDAVPVVHGYWHIDDYDSGEPDGYAAFIEVHCSKCGYELCAESGQYGWCYGDPFPLNYCPNCGAVMDLEVE